ncbi:hypothetical protein [Pseudolabrys sp. Root1462]|uniref:hypothetical protein n=1 Tax=Pseudolabrys sp. Root1462 TaxID=1736466 RepID=UPI0009EC2AEA|nr:hypothetical protein [Pseudolabrys sp. Root1462]
MRMLYAVALCATVGLIAASPSAHAQQKTVKACEDEWKANKAANQAAKITQKAYVAQCRTGAAAPAKPAAVAPAATAPAKPAAVAPAATAPAAPAVAAPVATRPAAPVSAATDKPKDGTAAMRARQKECGAEWKADKAAGKTGGLTWPKYWSACNTRKKAAGM